MKVAYCRCFGKLNKTVSCHRRLCLNLFLKVSSTTRYECNVENNTVV